MAHSANQLVENFFRHESANLIAVLTRAFGVRRIDLVEDMVQVAMLEAMHAWKESGIPDNPAGWMHRAAKNRVLDALRREKIYEQAAIQSGQDVGSQERVVDRWLEEERIPDSLLRMIFVCCHPSLDRNSQIALTLKTLCGFSVAEIARGLLLSQETVKKRVQRARAALSAANVEIELPSDDQLLQRLDVVHDVLYLMFNEGYSTSSGTEPIRDDMCEEAARLCHLLCESPCSSPTTQALLALLLFHSARLESRTDETGAAILLEDQDRSKWDRRLICAGRERLVASKTDEPTVFHLEAAISMQHCIASTIAETDWATIVRLYGRLRQLRDSPIYALNQAIAIGEAGDPQSGLSQLTMLHDRGLLTHYLLLDCAMGRLHELLGDTDLAAECYSRALQKRAAPHERALLERKLQKLAGI